MHGGLLCRFAAHGNEPGLADVIVSAATTDNRTQDFCMVISPVTSDKA